MVNNLSIKSLKNSTKSLPGGFDEFGFHNTEIQRKNGWPNTHLEFDDNEQVGMVEIACCAVEFPTDVLSQIIHWMTILTHKNILVESYRKASIQKYAKA